MNHFNLHELHEVIFKFHFKYELTSLDMFVGIDSEEDKNTTRQRWLIMTRWSTKYKQREDDKTYTTKKGVGPRPLAPPARPSLAAARTSKSVHSYWHGVPPRLQLQRDLSRVYKGCPARTSPWRRTPRRPQRCPVRTSPTAFRWGRIWVFWEWHSIPH